MQRIDEPSFDVQVKLREWQYRAANWAAVVGVFHAVLGLVWAVPLALASDMDMVPLPVMLFIAPAAWHLTSAAGISRSARWGWRMESAFAPLHAASIVVALLWPIIRDRSVIRFAPESWMPALVFGPIGVAPLLWLMYCLRGCRRNTWSGEHDTPAFEVIPTNRND
ncbi:MAG: hypothetical protein H7Z14_10790 [Anaerolineae bacterium]|nr:hypothetical protein [Phycisphaerae bacterium]